MYTLSFSTWRPWNAALSGPAPEKLTKPNLTKNIKTKFKKPNLT